MIASDMYKTDEQISINIPLSPSSPDTSINTKFGNFSSEDKNSILSQQTNEIKTFTFSSQENRINSENPQREELKNTELIKNLGNSPRFASSKNFSEPRSVIYDKLYQFISNNLEKYSQEVNIKQKDFKREKKEIEKSLKIQPPTKESNEKMNDKMNKKLKGIEDIKEKYVREIETFFTRYLEIQLNNKDSHEKDLIEENEKLKNQVLRLQTSKSELEFQLNDLKKQKRSEDSSQFKQDEMLRLLQDQITKKDNENEYLKKSNIHNLGALRDLQMFIDKEKSESFENCLNEAENISSYLKNRFEQIEVENLYLKKDKEEKYILLEENKVLNCKIQEMISERLFLKDDYDNLQEVIRDKEMDLVDLDDENKQLEISLKQLKEYAFHLEIENKQILERLRIVMSDS